MQDLIPDFIPILGLIDDLIILPGLIWLTIKLVPKHVWTEAQLRAQTEPLRLRHNYAAFVFVLLTWDMGLLALAYIVCKHLHIKWLQQEHNLWLLLAALSAAMVVAETVWGCMLWRAERPKPAAEAAQTDPLLLPTQSVDS